MRAATTATQPDLATRHGPPRSGMACAEATASGQRSVRGSWDRFCSQAKNRMNARSRAAWSRTVPASASSGPPAVQHRALVTGPPRPARLRLTRARVRRCAGSTSRIMAGRGPRPTARPADPAPIGAHCRPLAEAYTSRPSCRSRRRTSRGCRLPSRPQHVDVAVSCGSRWSGPPTRPRLSGSGRPSRLRGEMLRVAGDRDH